MSKNIVLTLLLLSALGSNAIADVVLVGDPVPGNSWSQQFGDTGYGSNAYDLIAIKMVSAGDSFEAPAIRNITQPGWSKSYQNSSPSPTIAAMSGPSLVGPLSFFDVFFDGPITLNPLSFEYFVFGTGSNVPLASYTFTWSGVTGTVVDWTRTQGALSAPTRGDFNPIPAPAAVALACLGVGLAGCWVKRRMA